MSDLISRADLMQFPIRIDHYDKENGNEHFVLGIESVLEFAEYLPAIDAVEVVRCGVCLYWQDRQVMLNDGSCRNYLPDEPDYVTASVGVNLGAHCTKHGFEDETGSWFWANAGDFCSRGERREYD